MALTRATDKIIANADGNLNLSGIVTASSFRGDGSQLTGVDASTLKNGSDTKAQANASGVVVTGVLTATSFRGDGSNLTNLPAGLGTALSSDQTSANNKLYYTNRVLSIGSTTTVDHPATASGAYTQYAEIQIEDNADLIIEDGDDLIPDILGLGDNQSTGAGGLGRLRVDTITNKSANGAPNFPNGLTGTTGTFSGNLNVGGVLTYEDVTNVDSVGVITARDGLRVTGVTTITGTGEYLLQLNKSDSSAVYTQFTNSTSGTSTSDGFRIGMDSNEDGLVWLREDGNVKFGTNNTERLRIESGGNVIIGTNSYAYTKPLNVQGSTGAILSLANYDTTSYAADTNTSIELRVNTGNTGNQNGACEIRAFKENGTNGNNARGLSFYTAGNGGSPAKRLVIHPEGWVEKINQLSLARYGNSNLSISNNSETVLSHFGGLAYETGGGNSYWGSNKFTCPVAGMYMVYCKINLNTNTNWGHDAFLAVRKNGSKSWFTGAGSDPWYDLLGANSEYYRGLFVFVNVPCAKNDEIDFLVRQNSGGTRTLYGSMSYFNIYHLG